MGVLEEYKRPGGIAIDKFDAAKRNDPERPHRVHVVLDEVTQRPREVWLNTEVSDFDGLCLGSGENCLAEAVASLEQAIRVLQAPPSPDVYRPAEPI
jgi:hypothetical protein